MEGYEDLYRRVSSQPQWLAPPLGRLRTLPPEIDTLSTPESAEQTVSNLLKELLVSRSIPDLERCLAKSDVLLLDYPTNADVILLHHQVEQALEREKIASIHRLRSRPLTSNVIGSMAVLFYFLFGTAKRAVATGVTIGVATGVGIGIYEVAKDVQESRRIAQELNRDTPAVSFPMDGQIVNRADRAVVTGRLGGPSSSQRFVYLIHYGDRGRILAHPISVGPDSTWQIDMGLFLVASAKVIRTIPLE